MTAPATVQPADVDPIDSLTFDEIGDSVTTEPAIPEHMMLGGKPKDEVPEPTVTTPEPVAEAKPDALPEGYKRDSLGRVHGPDGKIVSSETLAKLTATPTPQPDDTAIAKPTPFQYRANGETKAVEGFELHADGSVRVSPEKASELRYLLNARDMLAQDSEFVNTVKSENATLKQRIASLESGSAAEIQKANALTQTLTSILQDPDEAKAIEGFFTLRAQFPTLLAKAEAQYWQQQAKSGKPVQPSQDQGQREAAKPHGLPTREVATQATTEHLERFKLEHEFRDVTDWKQFEDRTRRTPLAYIVPATAEHANQYGVAVGESVFDTDALLDDMKQYAASTKAAREVAASQAKLAAETARKTQTSITAPPTPGGGGSPPRAGSKPIQSKQDWEDYMTSSEV